MANRRKQIAALQLNITSCLEEAQSLLEELETAFENTPESLQYSERGQLMQDRIETLHEWVDQLEAMTELVP